MFNNESVQTSGICIDGPHPSPLNGSESAALHRSSLHCSTLHCTALNCTALHSTAVQCSAKHCTGARLHFTDSDRVHTDQVQCTVHSGKHCFLFVCH